MDDHRRALQGAGAALVAPSTLALLTAHFPEGRERTRAVGWYGATAGIGASLGLVLGGLLTSWVSWRVGFFINVPLGIAMVLAAPRVLAETDRRPGRFDLPGALTVFAATNSSGLDPRVLLAHRIGTTLTASAGMLALALIAALVLIPGTRKAGRQGTAAPNSGQKDAA